MDSDVEAATSSPVPKKRHGRSPSGAEENGDDDQKRTDMQSSVQGFVVTVLYLLSLPLVLAGWILQKMLSWLYISQRYIRSEETPPQNLTVLGDMNTVAGIKTQLKLTLKSEYHRVPNAVRSTKAEEISVHWATSQGQPVNNIMFSIRMADDKSAFLIQYKCAKAGTYALSVRYRGAPVSGSPFFVVIVAGDVDPNKCEIRHQTRMLLGSTGSNAFTLIVRDSLQNPQTMVTGKFRGYVERVDCSRRYARVCIMSMKPCGPGEYECAKPTLPCGEYLMHITYNDRDNDIAGGPFRFYVLEKEDFEGVRKLMTKGSVRFVARMVVNLSRIREPEPVSGLHKRLEWINFLGRDPVACRDGGICAKNLNVCGRDVFEVQNSAEQVELEVVISMDPHLIAIRHEGVGLFSRKVTLIYLIKMRPEIRLEYDPKASNIVNLHSPDSSTPIVFAISNPTVFSATMGELLLKERNLDFQNRMKALKNRINRLRRPGRVDVRVRRQHVFADSYVQLRYKSPQEMRKPLRIQFDGEKGIDGGGLTREWFLILTRQLFDPLFGLFTTQGNGMYAPSSHSSILPNHLELIYFCGQMVAKAITENVNLEVHFTRSFYKIILGKPVSFYDLEVDDPQLFKSAVRYLLENDITGVDLGLSFVVEEDHFGELRRHELVKNGDSVPVTERNKLEYIQLLTEYKLRGSVQKQIDSFLRGFFENVPRELISGFSDAELELLICGLPEISVEELRNNTEYQGYDVDSNVVQWFWKVVSEELDTELRCKLFQFVTGTSKVPVGGVRTLVPKFAVCRGEGGTNRLPSAHTCFHQLHLPEYQTYEQLRRCLHTAITEGSEGFGLS